MKDIGESFKEKRETMGVKTHEVCEDLDITEAQLENLEEGNLNAFKDIFFLKDLIKKYSKYLNLDEEAIINEFNEYIFDYTSKIPVKELTQQLRVIKEKEKEERKVASPYTQKAKITNKVNPIFIYIGLVILIVVVAISVISIVKTSVEKENTISYVVE